MTLELRLRLASLHTNIQDAISSHKNKSYTAIAYAANHLATNHPPELAVAHHEQQDTNLDSQHKISSLTSALQAKKKTHL